MTIATELPIVARAKTHADRVAIVDGDGPHTYLALLDASERIASALLAGSDDLDEARVAFYVQPGFGYTAALWGIWRAGGVAVPLCLSHPLPELAYVLDDTGANHLLLDASGGHLRPLADERGLAPLSLADASAAPVRDLPTIGPERRAMMLYTSGTTSRPKGVVTTHANIEAMVTALIEAWGWTEEDRILHVLPLHHTHGIVNVLLCALWAGAACEMLPRFDAEHVWRRFVGSPLTLFMAVPTIYRRLIRAWEDASPDEQQRRSEACRKQRLMVSGSAALPVRVLATWERISGHRLLERYGMTETGMILSNPLLGERRPGFVGRPVPSMQVRLVDDAGRVIDEERTPGNVQVRGPSVFREYWQRPDATAEAFTADGWFRTGDVAVVEEGAYRLLGRSSVDIIKTGGEKVSALEIEEVLRRHPAIRECAVVGVPDTDWGERVCAAVEGEALSLEELRAWAKERLAPFKVPTRLRVVDALPRNAMGKVTKPAVRTLFEDVADPG